MYQKLSVIARCIHGPPEPPEPDEPEHLAAAVKDLELRYAVITSVTRDDLTDGGAGHFAACVEKVKEKNPGCMVEVLILGFQICTQQCAGLCHRFVSGYHQP